MLRLPDPLRQDPTEARSHLPVSQVLERNIPVLATLALTTVGAIAWYALRRPPIPPTAIPVSDFELGRYLGKWYEVARIDNRFEKGLQRTQAEYSRLPNGGIRVENRGYDPRKREWHIATGKAKTVLGPDVGALKVAFFGPFYDGYNVVALDPKYRWAMVVGSQLDRFWILSRTPFLPMGVEERLLRQAREMGVPVDRVIWVHQDGVNPTGSY
ncbi:lipocalin family protein [Comamonas terrigena]|uniref:lipocalin family protein n=1 Tax=Comamonas terrigena TaxID=32013 RepID=UPI00289AD391|nr:lipocalin family protein [Comamonas terrigena]